MYTELNSGDPLFESVLNEGEEEESESILPYHEENYGAQVSTTYINYSVILSSR